MNIHYVTEEDLRLTAFKERPNLLPNRDGTIDIREYPDYMKEEVQNYEHNINARASHVCGYTEGYSGEPGSSIHPGGTA